MEYSFSPYIFTFYIKNEEGYKELLSLSNKINKNEDITLDYLKTIKNNIVVLSSSSPIFNNINENIFINDLRNLKESFPSFFIGLDNHDFIPQSHIDLIREFSSSFNFKLIPFSLYKNKDKEDSVTLKLLDAIEKNYTLSKEELISPSFHFLNDLEIDALFKKEEIDNLKEFINLIDFNFIKNRGKLIDYPSSINSDLTSDKLLIELIYKGLNEKNINIKENKIYRDRLNYEYKIISSMGFSNYFLVVQDYIKFAKSQDILVGPGRGSAAGSLIAYLLGITTIDPIKYGLLFERFLNPSRNTMPDIDVDFQDVRREEIVNYLENKYGYDRVAKVIAFQTIKAKNAIRDVTRVLGYPVKIAELINKKIPDKYKTKEGSLDYSLNEVYNDIDAFKENIDNIVDNKLIFENAKRIEGLPRQIGLHAAGVVLTNDSLFNTMPINYINEKEIRTQYEKDYLEEQGFLKFDILGLRNLTTIANCLYLINKNYNLNLTFDDIPLEDKLIYDFLKTGDLMGLFQIDASAGRLAILKIKPDNFKEVTDAISLARPGPIAYLDNYVNRKNKKEKIIYPSSSLIPILSSTYGIIIYQEQIMKIAQKYSSFTFAEADLFRRAISKKHAEEILKMKNKFILGAKKNNHNEKEANEIFNMILKFASYGFNQSHAVAYAMITVKMTYLKAKYTTEFYSSILSTTSNDTKFLETLNEINKHDITLKLPDINTSGLFFIPNKKSLIYPINKIKDIPQSLAISIVKERKERGKFESFKDFISRSVNFESKLNKDKLSILIDAGCFDSFNKNRKALKQAIPLAMKEIESGGLLFNSIENKKELTFNNIEEDKEEKIRNELNALGILISLSLLDYIALNDEEKKTISPYYKIKINQKAKVLGVIKSIKTITLKQGKNIGNPMAFIGITNYNEDMEVVFFPNEYKKYSSILEIGKIFILEVKKDINKNKESFIIEDMKEVKLYE